MVILRFSASRSRSARAIQLWTWSWPSHVDFELPDGTLLGAVPGQGVSLRKIDGTAGKLGREIRVERYAVHLPLIASTTVIEQAMGQLGKPYDWKAIGGMLLRHDWQSEDKWFCSELVTWSFKQAGHSILQADHLNRITPRDLLLSTQLRPIPA